MLRKERVQLDLNCDWTNGAGRRSACGVAMQERVELCGCHVGAPNGPDETSVNCSLELAPDREIRSGTVGRQWEERVRRAQYLYTPANQREAYNAANLYPCRAA